MKKILFVIVLGITFLGANAQSTFQQGTKLLGATIGFSSDGTPIAVTYEIGVKNNLFNVNKLNLGIGGYLGVFGNIKSTENYGLTVNTTVLTIAPGVRALAHYQIIDKLDAYVGPSIGFALQRSTADSESTAEVTETGLKFSWGFIGGLRYEITPKWGAFVEAGKASGSLTLGAAYKF